MNKYNEKRFSIHDFWHFQSLIAHAKRCEFTLHICLANGNSPFSLISDRTFRYGAEKVVFSQLRDVESFLLGIEFEQSEKPEDEAVG